LIGHISKKAALNKQEATAVLESFFETIKQTLESGEDVLISGFGKFCVKEKGKMNSGVSDILSRVWNSEIKLCAFPPIMFPGG